MGQMTQPSALRRRAASAPLADTPDHSLEEELDDLRHWRGREVEQAQPSPQALLQQQAEVTPEMRWMLIDWFGEVRDELRLGDEALFLATRLVDRFLCAKPVSRGRLQLLGLASLWVACKYEEVCPPSARQMLGMAEDMYTAEDIKAMEREILFTLGFELACPTALRFLHYLLLLAPLPAAPDEAYSVRRLAEALLELTQLDVAYLRAPPSVVAAAALYLALGLTGAHASLPAVLSLSGADPELLGGLVKDLANTLSAVTARQQQLQAQAQQAAAPGGQQQQHAAQQPCALLGRYLQWQAWCVARRQQQQALAAALLAQQQLQLMAAAALGDGCVLVTLPGHGQGQAQRASSCTTAPPQQRPLNRCVKNFPIASATTAVRHCAPAGIPRLAECY